jgi:uncharacterized RDD family membrane protein YckC
VTNPYAPPAAIVADVVPVAEEIMLAGRGVRLGAALLDSLIGGACLYLPFLAGLLPFSAAGQRYAGPGVVVGALLALVAISIWAFFTIKYVAANGQTIAKRLLGIKVVRTDGSRATISRLFWLRNMVATIPSAVPILGTVYAIVDALFIFRENRKCLHDYIADTVVIVA